jgi:hypothetical protein
MSFFIVTFPTAGVSQDELAKLTHIGSYRLKSNLSHLLVQKKPTIGELLNQSSALTYTSITISRISHTPCAQSNGFFKHIKS